MKKPKERPYAGDLAKPLGRFPRGGASKPSDEANDARLTNEIRRRRTLLFEHYGIFPKNPDRPSARDWGTLASFLAAVHVPGLRFDTRGRPSTPGQIASRLWLLREVDCLQPAVKAFDSNAAKKLLKKWNRSKPNEPRFAKMKQGTLRKQIAKARTERRQNRLYQALAIGLARLRDPSAGR